MQSTATPAPLTTAHSIALYTGALLGPSLLLLPGLAAASAGPASIISWLAMLALSGLLAITFAVLGARYPARGVSGYVAAAFGERWAAAASWCFLGGVIAGAPVVCLIGGNYVAVLLGGGEATALIASALLLAVVLLVTASGARASARVQLALVGVMVAVVAVAVVGALPSVRATNWHPFLPHGTASIGTAASQLMLSFVGWESVAALTHRLRDPSRQLPRVIASAFAATSAIYLGLAATSIAVLGPAAGEEVALTDLLRVALGGAAPVVTAITAVALTLAATNAYITGGVALLRQSARHGTPPRTWIVPGGIAVVGALAIGARATGFADTAQLVSVPSALFLAVYLAATLAGSVVLGGAVRAVSIAAAVCVLAVIVFIGGAMLIAVAVGAVALVVTRRPARGAPSTRRAVS